MGKMERCTKRRHDIIKLEKDPMGYNLAKLSLLNKQRCGQGVAFNTIDEMEELRDKLTDFIITEKMNS